MPTIETIRENINSLNLQIKHCNDQLLKDMEVFEKKEYKEVIKDCLEKIARLKLILKII